MEGYIIGIICGGCALIIIIISTIAYSKRHKKTKPTMSYSGQKSGIFHKNYKDSKSKIGSIKPNNFPKSQVTRFNFMRNKNSMEIGYNSPKSKDIILFSKKASNDIVMNPQKNNFKGEPDDKNKSSTNNNVIASSKIMEDYNSEIITMKTGGSKRYEVKSLLDVKGINVLNNNAYLKVKGETPQDQAKIFDDSKKVKSISMNDNKIDV